MKTTTKDNKPLLAPEDYLAMPYTRAIVRENNGTYRGEILEFPGCVAVGDTDVEALSLLNEVALAWLESQLATGQPIPAPMESNEYSGKLVMRMPRSLHRKATYAAERDGVSLNQFIVAAVAEQVGVRSVPVAQADAIAQGTMAQIMSGRWMTMVSPGSNLDYPTVVPGAARPSFGLFNQPEGPSPLTMIPHLAMIERRHA